MDAEKEKAVRVRLRRIAGQAQAVEVQVELYADGVKDATPVRQEMKHVRQLEGSPDGSLYSGVVYAVGPPADYTPRATTRCDGVAIPLEDACILWQR